jgi:DNA-binding beta-propeller fold protein YncE
LRSRRISFLFFRHTLAFLLPRHAPALIGLIATSLIAPSPARAAYVNFEASQVHPIALTGAGDRLLVVNTPDGRLEVFDVAGDGSLAKSFSVPVGLEPVSVAWRMNPASGHEEAWVVNLLSDSVSIVDLDLHQVIRSLSVGDEPTDVAFAQSRAFVTVSQEDAVRVLNLPLPVPPTSPVTATVPLFGRQPRALAVGAGGTRVYAVLQKSGNQTTVVDSNVIFGNNPNLNQTRLSQLGLNTIACGGTCVGGSNPGASCTNNNLCLNGGTCPGAVPPPYPPLPSGVTRNPALIDPPDGVPKVSLIVKFQDGTCAGGPTPGAACTATAQCGAGGTCSAKWVDEAGQNWSPCLPFRLPDHDLFVIDATNPGAAPQFVDHLGTTLFEVAVNPISGKAYIPNTDARNFTRFEHPLGVQGHMVDNQLTVVDPAAGNAVTRIDLNAHINRASDPAANLAERQASISQPGMMVWKADGSSAYLTAIGSRKLFVVDGSCLAGSCIFGPNRASPNAVVVGEGPTGVALSESKQRAYVLLRFTNSVAIVNTAPLSKLGEVGLHDPSPQITRDGRRLLYDGIDTSGHGDAACSSCHISGDMDGLSWDLGNPEGTLAAYSLANDNVRFVLPIGGSPQPCDPSQPLCASHQGFDPQKGPMATQSMRAMLEPLHWRGDRATMREFNKAFVGLMGTADIGPINGEPAGLTGPQMDLYRSFALAIRMPPNPFRNANDSLPNLNVQPPGSPFAGNPANGEMLFNTLAADAGQPCVACHALPFGSAGGKLGGVPPQEPTSPDTTALFNGTPDGSPHSDLEIPHLRNMYVKFGPTFGVAGTASPPESKTGFGFIHDGAIPDMGTFLSANVFNLTAAQARDIATFMFHFPTGTKPAVGKQITVPAGAPPTGSAADETLLATLIGVGNLTDPGRHCELVAAAPSATRLGTYYLNGGAGSGGLWTADVAGELQVSTLTLRSDAAGPVTFLCVPIGEGIRQGADLDEDARLNADDCNAADGGAWSSATEVMNLGVAPGAPTHLSWDEQASLTGPGVVYNAVGGSLLALRASGLVAATTCLSGDLTLNGFDDSRANPPVGDGYYYLTRARNSCADGGFGSGRAVLNALTCAP